MGYIQSGTVDIKEQTVIFSPTLNVQHSQDEKNLPVLYKSDAFLSGKKKGFKSKIRLLYMIGERATREPYRLMYRGSDYVLPTNRYGYASMIMEGRNFLFDLPREYCVSEGIERDEGTALYNHYHSQQIRDLIDDNLIVMECKGYLTENDINTLDLFKPIFLQSNYGNSYFKILEIEYTNSHEPANIKLPKILIK